MNLQWWRNSAGIAGVALAAFLIPGAYAARTAIPGTLNYVQGQVALDGNQLTTQQVGEAELQPDQVLSTGQGKAEVLLSPGAFLRVGDNSQVRMLSNDLVNPRVDIIQGEAMVEVDYKPKQAEINVMERGADTSLLKQGLYRFNSDEGQVQVIDGKARVTDNGQSKEIGKGKQIVLTGGPLKAVKFDRKAEDDLYRWSNVRAAYLAEANQQTARTVYVDGGWWGPGWYWNPYFSMYSWLPGSGFFYSPFGYPFFSPGYVIYAAPGAGRFDNGGHVVRGINPGRATTAVRPLGGAGFRPMGGERALSTAPHAGFSGGGFRGGFRGGGHR